jgi:hypothetical protein
MTVRTLTATFLAVNLAVMLPPVTSALDRLGRLRPRSCDTLDVYETHKSCA